MPLASTSGTRLDRTRTFSTSRTNGSAYGYSNNYRNCLARNATWNGRRASLHSSSRRRRGSAFDRVTDGSELNFAQRLLLANKNTVTNIADLWVAAAMNVDNEDPFESDSETEQNDHFTEPIFSAQGVDVDSSTNLDSIIPDGDVETDSIDASPSMASTPRPHRPSIAASTSASFGPSSRRPSVSFSPAIRSAIPRRLSSGVIGGGMVVALSGVVVATTSRCGGGGGGGMRWRKWWWWCGRCCRVTVWWLQHVVCGTVVVVGMVTALVSACGRSRRITVWWWWLVVSSLV